MTADDAGLAFQADALDERCGRYLTFRDLIEAGETWQRLRIPNLPKQRATIEAMRALAKEVLDPVANEFGRLTITYGFASWDLLKRIPERIHPSGDQHAGHELCPNGKPICSRLGQAVDFKIEGVSSHRVAVWIGANLAFDRMYLYGPDLPLHVSVGPECSSAIITMFRLPSGRRMPRQRSLAWLAEQSEQT